MPPELSPRRCHRLHVHRGAVGNSLPPRWCERRRRAWSNAIWSRAWPRGARAYARLPMARARRSSPR